MVVAGISLNSRSFSVAIVDPGYLIDYKVCLFKEKWSVKKHDRMIRRLFKFLKPHQIDVVSLGLPFPHHGTKNAQLLIDTIKKECVIKSITVNTFLATDLFLAADGRRLSRREFMKSFAARYPDLLTLFEKEMKNRSRYYNKLFEAVSLANLLLSQQSFIS